MSTWNDVKKTYAAELPLREKFLSWGRGYIRDGLELRRISFSVVEGRVKSIGSFAEKLQRPGKNYKDPLREISDLVGIRVLVASTDMIDPVCEMLRRQFKVDETRSVDYRHQSNASSPHYKSVHLIIGLSDEQQKYDVDGFKDLVAEVQVRTVLQNGWAEISHISAYKLDPESKDNIAPRLTDAALMLEKVDQIFSEIGIIEDTTRRKVEERIDAGDLSSSVSAFSIPVYVKHSPTVGEIAAIVRSENFEMSDSLSEEAVEQLICTAQIAGLRTLEDLEGKLGSLLPMGKAFFHAFQKRRKYRSTGSATHWATVLLTASQRGLFEDTALQKSLGWDQDFKTDLLAAAIEAGM